MGGKSNQGCTVMIFTESSYRVPPCAVLTRSFGLHVSAVVGGHSQAQPLRRLTGSLRQAAEQLKPQVHTTAAHALEM
eukprot:45100-Eustigmatos_ZCMA.PRE.1